MASNVVLSNEEFNVVGSRPIRHDGNDKVTGRARYSADMTLPRLLHGKILRSPHAHARIKAIDPTRALALSGVKAVVTSADFAQPSGKVADLGEGAMANPKWISNNCMASEKALYKGHAVAAVAATSLQVAEEALALIDVDYEVLPAVTDIIEAMKDDAPVLHERLANSQNVDIRPGGLRDDDDAGKATNISNHFVFELGDAEKGFKEADIIVEREYRTATVHQGYIEPHSATAMWGEDGKLTVWCSSQGHFQIRDLTSLVLGIPVSQIKVVPMEIGGGFGGKTVIYLEPVAAALSKKAGRPVKISMARPEVFEATGPTSGSFIRVKIGANKKGMITAADVTMMYEAGGFPGSPIVQACQCVLTPYEVANGRIEGYDVVVNKPKAAAYRAPGVPAAAFATESVIDEICEKLGMDPLEFRVKNGTQEGSRRIPGPVLQTVGYQETLAAAMQTDHYKSTLEGPNRGRGVAAGFWFNGTGPACATASVNGDGTVSLTEGSPDIGGGRVSMAIQMAEVLGIPAEDVHPSVGDTDAVGYTSLTAGSGATFKSGWASYEAAHDIKQQIIERAARIWEIDVKDVEFKEGLASHKSDPELKLNFKQIAARLNSTGGPIVGRGNVNPAGVGNAFAVHIVDVEVDPDTGKVDVLRYTALQDVGKAVHPSYVEGQLQGGVAQGIGWALNEEYVYNDSGEMSNSSFLDYRMPTSLDLPMIDTVIVEVANPGHPFGVRGVGEVCIVPPMGAVANAIHNAAGVRMDVLPMSPANVLEALWAKDGE
ncbi:MAG: xanthine dehydrogenase family protein molybdopterin-binding subunit [SAR202 cluster bacterium]|uniref:Xanthine dehydrogenase, molybdenum binding subunit n=1 Tax=hydrothermal vent metagenome TaxID=652676 RepID=A0A160VGI1_9ZZZZ|nr:xanthine dehydrogenase family protein molybdopterin-binding subunit [Dehalococcoidia bacterium]MQF90709.1 xanthine dehydrogenase family protein molybdopterin-binding subunit [SAR202 cluster bacterium]MQG41028.1 xanthine dehydrogenase family protein molybdopterin-binding subunit [SAR202 cluster bacterium]MQG45109.1 xanthine dehydrogenase family protein molybdopterin-binding subunit [SAR202 cluster bacterium]MQG63305.1 xanthine dehydrogenase family protein molybdopterin-binding subunit [SAR202|tara:strand:+ start:1806 stop:4118 length:2313 start_codon:yes stop_codon:yes gene_type:complete